MVDKETNELLPWTVSRVGPVGLGQPRDHMVNHPSRGFYEVGSLLEAAESIAKQR